MAHFAYRRRRGVLLLIVLSMLVLFMLLMITYVIVATRERSVAKSYTQVERSGDPPAQLLDSIAMILFRDTNDAHCPLRSWSLLEGIYGNVSFHGSVASTPQPQAGGQFLMINTTASQTTAAPGNSQNYFKGCVLTMLNGPCQGCSTRIVASSNGSLTVMRFKADAAYGSGGQLLLDDPNANDAFLVNGRPYCGMGRGYNVTKAATPAFEANDAVDPNNWPYALLPNSASFQPNGAYQDPAGPGGANVDYTAWDYQNLYLGLVTNSSSQAVPAILPSYYRPDLYAYWRAQVANLDANVAPGAAPDPTAAALLRKILLRPNKYDHPLFCAATNPSLSNPGAAGVATFPVDVDNMGNGAPDSIWMDVGLPVQTTRDGRTYKPLVAMLCLDLDGRINVNAHGSFFQNEQRYPYGAGMEQVTGPIAGGAATVSLPAGMGIGPPDFNLRPLISAGEISNLTGDGGAANGAGSQGRYGTARSPAARRGLTAYKFFDFPPTDYRGVPPSSGPGAGLTLTSYGSPLDIRGWRCMALDYRGQPLWLTPGSSPTDTNYWQGELFNSAPAAGNPFSQTDNPYGFDLSSGVPRPGRSVPAPSTPAGPFYDNPITVAEFERVQRMPDVDARELPVRLLNLLSSLQQNPQNRNKVTSDSFDLPSPNLQAPRDLRPALASLYGNGGRAYQITDLLRAKLSKTAVPQNSWDTEIVKLLPPELIAGVRMDINRPLGSGRDVNGNNVVDDPAASANAGVSPMGASNPNGLPFWPSTFPQSGGVPAVPFNLTNGLATLPPGLGARANGIMARQLMARQLYALMMLFSDQGYVNWTSPSENPALTQAQQQELTARRVAQWAINAVTFRDPTSIMIPFEYHSQIFQSGYAGWQLDGDVGTDESQTAGVSDRRVVWGCKPPDVVLTESLAFHDLRVADTSFDNGPKGKTTDSDPNKKDPDFDQTRVPQGSAFFELYCCRNGNNPVAPGDLYSYANGQWGLDLGRMAPAGANGSPMPVWRMAITQSKTSPVVNPNANFAAYVGSHPDSSVSQSPPNDPGTAPDPTAPPVSMRLNAFGADSAIIERIVWLGQQPPQQNVRTNVYYNRNGPTLLAPGYYAVVGPRKATAVGAQPPGASGPYGVPAAQTVLLSPTMSTSGTSNDAVAANIKVPVLGIVCAADPPPSWTNAAHTTTGIGVNVSEPLPVNVDTNLYYPEPLFPNTKPIPGTALPPDVDSYGDGTATNPFRDHPLDIGILDPEAPNRPLEKDGIAKTGTTPFYKTVFLQRLADPTQAFDPLRNPYITVDWMPIDLTVFNGEESPTIANPNDAGAMNPIVQFASRQRGGSNQANNPGTTSPLYHNLWSVVNAGDTLPATAVGGVANANFSVQLKHSLGYLNQAFGPGFIPTNLPINPQTGAPYTQFLGDPTTKPFPWLTWNARPYASVFELLLVPASSPDRLLLEFSTAAASGTLPNVYDPTAAGSSRAPFSHLLNFYSESAPTTPTTDPSPKPASASNFYRVLEYLQVPSKFIGTETVLSPSVFTANGNTAGTQFFLPPFNTVSNYRDPGKLNLNTMTALEIFEGLMNGMAAPTWANFNTSRAGVATTSDVISPSNTSTAALPTYFANPFRSAAGGDLVPIQSMIHRGVNVTLLRGSTGTPDGTALTNYAPNNKPLFNPTIVGGDYINSDRNAYFRYQALERISNLVTTRSNVFAVWITVGYFEARPWPLAGINPPAASLTPADYAAHPDGYQLGGELGSDTGEIERHRAFYIFDRSIPVGYERGQNHNVNRAILLRRYIE